MVKKSSPMFRKYKSKTNEYELKYHAYELKTHESEPKSHAFKPYFIIFGSVVLHLVECYFYTNHVDYQKVSAV